MPDGLNLRRNVFYAVAEFGIGAALLFLSYRLIIAQGGLAILGLWSTLYAWTTLIRAGDLGMASTTTRFVALHDARTDPERVRQYLETGILSQAVLYLVLAVAGYFGLSPFIGAIVGAEHRNQAELVLPYLFAGFFFLNLSGAIIGGIQGLHLGYVRSQLVVFGTVLQLVGVVVLVPQLQLLGLAIAQLIQHIVVGALGWLLLRRYAGSRNWIPWRFNRKMFREMLKFGLASQVANAANGLFEPLSKMLVGAFGGLHVLGLFELAYKTVALPRNTVVAGVSASIPAMSRLLRTQPEKARDLYRHSVRRITLAMGVVGLLLIVAAPLASVVMTTGLDPIYLWFCAILFAGFAVNSNGAASYNVGIASGNLTGNIIAGSLALVLLAGLGALLGLIVPVYGAAIATAAGLGAAGVATRLLNEALLSPRPAAA